MQKQDENTVYNRMDRALRLYQEHGESILATPEMQRLLGLYDSSIGHTQETVRQAGMAAACGLCAEQIGSCCFEEVETWYDPMLLLINRLLSADLPRSREIPGQCLFLGEEGCRLRARYSFCLNYFCPTLKLRLSPGLMDITLAAIGQELAAGWELEQALYRWLKKSS